MYIHLNGHRCLNCGIGWYDGYKSNKTRPCYHCGDIRLAIITLVEFHKLIKERDNKLFQQEEKHEI